MIKPTPFESHTVEYDIWFEKHKAAYMSELETIRQLLPRSGNGIEIGVGTGRFAAPLGIKRGIEPASDMRKLAKKRGIDVNDGMAESIPVKDGAYDYGLMVTISYLMDTERAFSEANRILKPGGSLILGFIDKQSSVGEKYDRYPVSSFYKDLHFFSVDEVISLMKSTGFGAFRFKQSLFENQLENIRHKEFPIDGYGKGAFVVVRGIKR